LPGAKDLILLVFILSDIKYRYFILDLPLKYRYFIHMTYIKRIHENKILSFIQDDTPYKNVLLIEGARQVGKTTLIEHVASRSSAPVFFVNLEKQVRLKQKIDGCKEFSEFEDVLEDELGFNGNRKAVLIIDESQESFRLGSFVRFMKES